MGAWRFGDFDSGLPFFGLFGEDPPGPDVYWPLLQKGKYGDPTPMIKGGEYVGDPVVSISGIDTTASSTDEVGSVSGPATQSTDSTAQTTTDNPKPSGGAIGDQLVAAVLFLFKSSPPSPSMPEDDTEEEEEEESSESERAPGGGNPLGDPHEYDPWSLRPEDDPMHLMVKKSSYHELNALGLAWAMSLPVPMDEDLTHVIDSLDPPSITGIDNVPLEGM